MLCATAMLAAWAAPAAPETASTSAAGSAATTPRAADGAALVRVEGGPAQAHRLVGRHGITRTEALPGTPYVKVDAPGRSAAALVAALQGDGDVLDAEPDYIYEALEVPDDTWFESQTHVPQVNASDDSWGLGIASSVPVAVIDSGIDMNHPDLQDHILSGVDFVDGGTPEDGCGHGTAVSGIIAADTNNNLGVAALGNGAPVIPVRVLEPSGQDCVTAISRLIQGISWAVSSGAKVINLSLGGPHSDAMRNSVLSAINSGIVVVAATGNAGASSPNYPAAYPEVISVGSTDGNNVVSSFSNRGADVMAPGEDVLTTDWDPANNDPAPYQYWSGTSFAAPIVSALVARMLAVTPGRLPAHLESDLETTALDLGPSGADNDYGAGIVDVATALSPARAGVGVSSTDAYEPNQFLDRPAIPSTLPLSATIGSPGDVDWYLITPDPGGWQVTVTPSGGVDPILTVFDASGDGIEESDIGGPGATESITVFAGTEEAPTYLVRVINARATTGSYTLSLPGGSVPFRTGTGPAPIIASSVADRSTNVPANVTFVLTASRPLRASTINVKSLNAVSSTGGAARPSSVSLDGTGTRVTATFALSTQADYVLTTRGWRASSGEPLHTSDPIRFQTGGITITPPPPTTTTTTTTPTPPPPAPPPAPRTGYWMVGRTGDVYAFGDARHLGNAGLPAGVTATNVTSTPSGNGYWVVTNIGSVHTFGDAVYAGGRPGLLLGESVTSISATPDGRGYWLFSNFGRVFAYGTAPHLGDMSGTRLNGGVLGSVATPSGRGYYMVAADGGIFSFGDAVFHGSMGAARLNGPVVGLAPDPDGAGYWLVASDGGIFSFSASFRGSMGSVRLNQPMIGMVAYGDGYLMVASDGGIFTFSSKPFAGSLGSNPPSQPIVAVSPLPD